MEEVKIQDEFDHKDERPQAVRLGRIHRLEIEIYVKEDVTPEQIEQAVSYELGSGSISTDNPLYENTFDLKCVEHRCDTGLNGITLWDAHGEHEPGKRYGKTITRRDGQPLGFVCTPSGEGKVNENE